MGYLAVGKTFHFSLHKHIARYGAYRIAGHELFGFHHFLELFEIPHVYPGYLMYLAQGNANLYGVGNGPYTIPRRFFELFQYYLLVFYLLAVGPYARTFYFERLGSFLYSLLERAAYGHNLTHGFHLKSKRAVRAVELIEVPTRNFHYHIVQRRLKKRRCSLRYLILEFVQSVSYRQFRRYLGYRVTGGL